MGRPRRTASVPAIPSLRILSTAETQTQLMAALPQQHRFSSSSFSSSMPSVLLQQHHRKVDVGICCSSHPDNNNNAGKEEEVKSSNNSNNNSNNATNLLLLLLPHSPFVSLTALSALFLLLVPGELLVGNNSGGGIGQAIAGELLATGPVAWWAVLRDEEEFSCGGGTFSYYAASIISIPCDRKSIHVCCEKHDVCYEQLHLNQTICDNQFCACLDSINSSAYCVTVAQPGLCLATRVFGHLFHWSANCTAGEQLPTAECLALEGAGRVL